MFIDESIRKYLEDASSGSPTPGGGSVAALAGAAGVSMACMAANFTTGPKYQAIQESIQRLLGQCAALRDDLAEIIDKDAEAYASVGQAYAMPRSTPAEKEARAQAIQNALRTAMEPPLSAVRACRAALGHIRELADLANPGLITDVGVAAILTEAALRAARLNVEINLKGIKNQKVVTTIRAEMDEAQAQARRLCEETHSIVSRALQSK
ncbi:MAG TPA: cyclodeaminase/cyclohydrolase family protein [Candidatus Brocadiia bacterium]|nr:cyclodeaminase/cyclohydrolase family protein [Candidatus Brocadiia bacterium]